MQATYTYYISGGSDNWIETNAKTLRGAKMIAMKTYEQSFNGKIEVGISRGGNSVDSVSVRYGLDKTWTGL